MRCLIGIDDENLVKVVEDYLTRMDMIFYFESTSNLETVQRLLKENEYDFMIASCCQHHDYNQKLLGWIRVMKIDIEVIYATHYNDLKHIQQAFRYGVCDYLLLPLTYPRFCNAIQRVVEKILFLNSQNQFTQKEIDDYISLAALEHKTCPDQSKGISHSTLERIEECLSDIKHPFTADQIAEQVELSRITVRRYLENMVEKGILNTKMEYGKIGRPNKLYEKNNT